MDPLNRERINAGHDIVEINADEKDRVIIQRALGIRTKYDLEIESLEVPMKPMWLRGLVILIRYYQDRISPKLGNRCVFDPSCSHYSELAFRKMGFWKACYVTMKRLCRCRPANGGTDLLPQHP